MTDERSHVLQLLRRAVSRNRKPIGHWRGNNAGTAILEFALVAPLLLCLVFGIFVYGVYFFTWIAVTHAASEGARASLAGLSTTERVQLATAQVNTLFSAYAPVLNIHNATIVAAQSASNPALFQVSITYDFSQFAFGVLGNVLPVPSQAPTITVTVSNGGYS
jgi:Flp pilus assembly protein TadG